MLRIFLLNDFYFLRHPQQSLATPQGVAMHTLGNTDLVVAKVMMKCKGVKVVVASAAALQNLWCCTKEIIEKNPLFG